MPGVKGVKPKTGLTKNQIQNII